MFGHLTYIIWLALFVGAPLLALGIIARRALWRQRRTLGWMLVGALGGGWAWDVLAVRLGAWYYDPRNIVGVWLGGLPIEEWLWIVGVSLLFGCVTIVVAGRGQETGDRRQGTGDRGQEAEAQVRLFPIAFLALGAWLSDPGHYSQLVMLLGSGVVFHALLWARNAPFLWSRRRIILVVTGIAEVWQLVSDPIGGMWGAWYFDPDRLLGIWLFGVTPIEDFLGIAMVGSAAACAVLVFGYGPRRWI